MIEPGQTLDFEASIGFLRDAPHYRRLTLWLALELGTISDPARARAVQYRAFDARVARRYAHVPGADLLLVVNHNTTRDELGAWEALGAELGFTLSVWDLSLQGGIDLTAEVHGGSALLSQFEGGTMVVLNNPIESAAGSTQPAQLVDKQQLLEAAAAGINVAFIGEQVELAQLMLPLGGAPVAADSGKHPGLTQWLDKLTETTDRELLAALRDRIDVTKWKIFGGCVSASVTEQAALALQKRLQRRFPDQRFVVVHEQEPRLIGKKLWARHWHVGTLEVRAMLPAAAGTLLAAEVPEGRLHLPSYVGSDANLMTFMLTRSFDEKLARLTKLLGGRKPLLVSSRDNKAAPTSRRARDDLLRILFDALLVDLANEQAAILNSRWRSGLSRQGMEEALPLLARLGQLASPADRRFAPDSVEGRHLIRLVARLRFLAEAQWSLWEWLPPLFWLRRAPRLWWLTRRLTRQVLFSFFAGGDEQDGLGESYMKGAYKELKSQYRSLDAECRDSMGGCRRKLRRAFASDLLEAPIARSGITSDAELFDRCNDRVIDASSWRHAITDAQARSLARATSMKASSQAADQLRRDETCDELVG